MRNQSWQTLGNYDERQFYQQVSRSNGDGLIDTQDTSVYFDSSIFPDRGYILRIHAYDAAKNHSSTEIEVIIKNWPTSLIDFTTNLPIVYPNPNSGQFKLKTNGHTIIKCEIYNSLGQLTADIDTKLSTTQDILIQKPGVYYIRLFGEENQVLLNQQVIVQD